MTPVKASRQKANPFLQLSLIRCSCDIMLHISVHKKREKVGSQTTRRCFLGNGLGLYNHFSCSIPNTKLHYLFP